MTAPVGLRVGWEFLTHFQYAVLFVDLCGSRCRIEEELHHIRALDDTMVRWSSQRLVAAQPSTYSLLDRPAAYRIASRSLAGLSPIACTDEILSRGQQRRTHSLLAAAQRKWECTQRCLRPISCLIRGQPDASPYQFPRAAHIRTLLKEVHQNVIVKGW
jgi:hypothetical protein